MLKYEQMERKMLDLYTLAVNAETETDMLYGFLRLSALCKYYYDKYGIYISTNTIQSTVNNENRLTFATIYLSILDADVTKDAIIDLGLANTDWTLTPSTVCRISSLGRTKLYSRDEV